MAFAIIDVLQVGFTNAVSGTASFYLPDTLTPAVVYGDDDGTAIGVSTALDSAGRATVYANQQLRMIVQTATGVTVSDSVINRELDSQVVLDSAGFTGDTVDDIGTAALAAFGGPDFRYTPGLGLNGMLPKTWMSGVWANVLAYASPTAPSVNDGVTLADSAINAAVAAVSAAGGGIVYFPPGTYLIANPIAVTSANGVSFRGAGSTVSTVKNSNGSGNALTFTTCAGFFIEDLGVGHSSSSTGAGISFTDCSRVRLERVQTSATHSTGVLVAGTSTITSFDDCEFLTVNGAAGARGMKFSGSGLYHWITDSIIGGGTIGSHIEFASTAGTAHVHRCYFPVLGSSTAINISGTGTLFSIVGCPSLISTATPFVFTGANQVIQIGNGIEGYTLDITSGGTMTPDLQRGNHIRFRLTTTGAGDTLAAPTQTPTIRGQKLILSIFNNAGGAITAYAAINAIYHLSATPSLNNLDVTTYTLLYDNDAGVWRDIGRTVTT